MIPAFLLAAAILFAGCGGDKEAPGQVGDTATTAGVRTDTASEAVAEFTEGTPVNDANTRYRFQLRPRVGDVFRYRIVERKGKELSGIKGSQESTYNFTTKVTGINSDSSITVEMRYDSIRVRQTSPRGPRDSTLQTLSYDTRQKPDSSIPGSEQLKALIGHRVNITLTKTGAVSDVSNVDPIISAIAGGKRDSISPQAMAMLRDAIKIQYYGLVLQELFLRFVPDTAVAAGAEWQRRDTMTIGALPSRTTFSYRLTEVKKVDNGVVGSLKMSLVADFPQKSLENKQISAKVNDAKVSGGGEGLYNLDNGFPVHKKTSIEQMMNYTMTAKVGPQKGQSETLAEKESSNVVVDLVEFRPGAGE